MGDDSRKTVTEVRTSLADKDYKGDDYFINKEIEKGPLTNRRCTDIICLLIFAAAVGVSGYIGVYSLENGDPLRIMAPMDADGHFCGKDPGYEDYPYVYFSYLQSPFLIWTPWAVCVPSCPELVYSIGKEFPCKPTDNVTLNSEGFCDMQGDPFDSDLFLDRWCLPIYDTLPQSLKNDYDNVIGSIGLDDVQSYVRDIERSVNLYYVCIGTCFVIIFLYNWFLRCFAVWLTWIAISIVGFGLAALGWLVMDYGAVNYVEGDNTQKWLNIAAYALWTLTGIYCLMICCLYYSIKISVRVLKTASKIITRNMRMVLVPVIGIILVTCWVAFAVYMLLYLVSCGEIQRKLVPLTNITSSTEIYYSTYVWTNEQQGFIWYSIFFFFWVTSFLMAVSQYVLIVAIVSWYFTENEETRGNFSIMRGYWWALRYNMGSLLFGSFVLALIWMIRTIFEYLNKKIQGDGDRPIPAPVKILLTCCRCCIACCHRFIKYVNMNAYCQVALTGESFCMAAMNGFILILKNGACFIFTGGLGGFFNLIGKLLVCVINMIIAYLLLDYQTNTVFIGDINSPIGPLFVVFIISYTISQIFMGMYTTCATCVLHCLFADIDICNQLEYDQMIGRNRPKEMRSIVKTLSKPRANSPSNANVDPERQALAPNK